MALDNKAKIGDIITTLQNITGMNNKAEIIASLNNMGANIPLDSEWGIVRDDISKRKYKVGDDIPFSKLGYDNGICMCHGSLESASSVSVVINNDKLLDSGKSVYQLYNNVIHHRISNNSMSNVKCFAYTNNYYYSIDGSSPQWLHVFDCNSGVKVKTEYYPSDIQYIYSDCDNYLYFKFSKSINKYDENLNLIWSMGMPTGYDTFGDMCINADGYIYLLIKRTGSTPTYDICAIDRNTGVIIKTTSSYFNYSSYDLHLCPCLNGVLMKRNQYALEYFNDSLQHAWTCYVGTSGDCIRVVNSICNKDVTTVYYTLNSGGGNLLFKNINMSNGAMVESSYYYFSHSVTCYGSSKINNDVSKIFTTVYNTSYPNYIDTYSFNSKIKLI